MRTAAHALDYDTQVCGVDAIAPLLQRLQQCIRETAERIIGGPISDAAWQQAVLPADLADVAASTH